MSLCFPDENNIKDNAALKQLIDLSVSLPLVFIHWLSSHIKMFMNKKVG